MEIAFCYLVIRIDGFGLELIGKDEYFSIGEGASKALIARSTISRFVFTSVS